MHIIFIVPNITLSVPDDLHQRMKKHREIRWSEVIRRVLAEKIRDLEMLDRITAKSALSLEDVDKLDHILKEFILRRYKEEDRP